MIMQLYLNLIEERESGHQYHRVDNY